MSVRSEKFDDFSWLYRKEYDSILNDFNKNKKREELKDLLSIKKNRSINNKKENNISINKFLMFLYLII